MIRKHKKKLKHIIVFIVVLSLIIGRYLYVKNNSSNIFYGYVNTDSIEIYSPVTTKIAKILVKEKDFVKKGDLLVQLDGSLIDAQIKQLHSQIFYEKEKANLFKFQEEKILEEYLNAKKDTSLDVREIGAKLKTLEKSQLVHKIQKAKIQMKEADLAYLLSEKRKNDIYSPCDGQAYDINIDHNICHHDQKIMKISNFEQRWVEFKIKKKDLSKFKIGTSLPLSLNTFNDCRFEGKVFDFFEDLNVPYAKVKVSISQIKKDPREKDALLADGMQVILKYE